MHISAPLIDSYPREYGSWSCAKEKLLLPLEAHDKFSGKNLTLSRPAGHFVPPSPQSQHIFKPAWSLELLLWEFSFYVFSIQKSPVPSISPDVSCHGNHPTFRFNLETQISIVFQVFPPERNFLWDNLLCFGHHNTLRSSIKANIRTVAMERFQEIILAK